MSSNDDDARGPAIPSPAQPPALDMSDLQPEQNLQDSFGPVGATAGTAASSARPNEDTPKREDIDMMASLRARIAEYERQVGALRHQATRKTRAQDLGTPVADAFVATPPPQDPTLSQAYPPNAFDTQDKLQAYWEAGGLTGMPAFDTSPSSERLIDPPPGLRRQTHEVTELRSQQEQDNPLIPRDMETDQELPLDVPPTSVSERQVLELKDRLREEYRIEFEFDLRLQIKEELEVLIYADVRKRLEASHEILLHRQIEDFKREFYKLYPAQSPSARELQAEQLANMGPAEQLFQKGKAFQEVQERRKAQESSYSAIKMSGAADEPKRPSLMTSQASQVADQARLVHEKASGSIVYSATKMKHPLLGISDLNVYDFRKLLMRAILYAAQPGHSPQCILTFFTEDAIEFLMREYNTKRKSLQLRHEIDLHEHTDDMNLSLAQFMLPNAAEQFLRIALMPVTSLEAEELAYQTIKATCKHHNLLPDKEGRLSLREFEPWCYQLLEVIMTMVAFFDWFPQTHLEGNKTVANQNAISNKANPKTGKLGLMNIIFAAVPGFGYVPQNAKEAHKPGSRLSPALVYIQNLDTTSVGETKPQSESQAFLLGRLHAYTTSMITAWGIVKPLVLTHSGNESAPQSGFYRSPSNERRARTEETPPPRARELSPYARESNRGFDKQRLQQLVARDFDSRGSAPSPEYAQAMALQRDFYNAHQDDAASGEEDYGPNVPFLPEHYPEPASSHGSRSGEMDVDSSRREYLQYMDRQHPAEYSPDNYRARQQHLLALDSRPLDRGDRFALQASPQENSGQRDRYADQRTSQARPSQDPRNDPRNSPRDQGRGGDSRYPLPANGQLVNTRPRPPYVPGNQRSIACRKYMAGNCLSKDGECPFSHDKVICDAEYMLIKGNMERPRSAAPANQQLVTTRPSGSTLQQVAQRVPAVTAARAVSWGEGDFPARVAQLDVHYNRELQMLQQEMAGFSQNNAVLAPADGDSEPGSGYSSAGDF